MNNDQISLAVFGVIFGLASLDGLRQTRELWRIHRRTTEPRNLITGAFVTIAAVITAFAILLGLLTLRRLLGFEQFAGSGFIVLAGVVAILLIPRFERWTIERIRRRV